MHRALNSQGERLDQPTLGFFRQRMGIDFSGVRIHADRASADSARDVQAHAYTVGSHIAFAPGKYAPGSTAGRSLLAHELTHVVQQNPSLQRRPSGRTTLMREPAGGGSTAGKNAAAPGATAASRASQLADLLERHANNADARLAAMARPASDKSAVRGDLAHLRDGIARIRQAASRGNDAECRKVLGLFTPARLRSAAHDLVGARDTPAAPTPVAVAERTPQGIAAKSLVVEGEETPAEREASRVADAVMSSDPKRAPAIGSYAGAGVQRYAPSPGNFTPVDVETLLEPALPEIESLVVTTGAEATTTVAAGGGVLAEGGLLAAGGTGVAELGAGGAAAATFLGLTPVGWVIIGVAVVAAVAIGVGVYVYSKRGAQPTPTPQPNAQPQPKPRPDEDTEGVPEECVEHARQLSRPGCRMIAKLGGSGGDPVANMFCQEATGGQPCEYWRLGENSNRALAKFDASMGRDVIECKCGYGGLAETFRLAREGSYRAQQAVNRLLEQLRSHKRLSADCDLQYRVIVSDAGMAEILREQMPDVDVVLHPSDLC
ncbi:DUF4157 domain-containing protein [Granulicella sp. WH15]|uniref:eCIS core domain-containing protein n=1 Tax=Granulicella sp. WH15 TaxID=2602070 RepID=UPI001C70758F|nr:DUF4157 domain-containing protein [Granulicella sp. WH15]